VESVAGEGLVVAHVTPDGKTGVLVELNSETDFVARNDDFKQLARTLAQKAANSSAETVEALLAEAHADAVIRLAHQQPRLVRARLSVGEERDRLWQRWVAVDPRIDAYADQRSTETPVIVLEPRGRTD